MYSYMSPSISHYHVHLVNQTKPPFLLPLPVACRLPRFQPLIHLPLLNRYGRCRQPPLYPISPQAGEYGERRKPCTRRIDGFVCLAAISDTDIGVEIDLVCSCEWIVCVYEAALGSLEVVSGKAVVNTAEREA